MISLSNHMNGILIKLTFLQTLVSNANTLNLTDLNIHAEDFYMTLLNFVGYNFTNANAEQQNYAYIDLIDHTNKVVIQVTSQNDNKKIKRSLDGYLSNPNNLGYKLKVLLIAKEAKSYKTAFGANFNAKDDVIDIKRLLLIIKRINDLSKLEEIHTFLKKNISERTETVVCNEVETLMELITFLSSNKQQSLVPIQTQVDPEKKIELRFADHQNFIRDSYCRLLSKYGIALETVKLKIDSLQVDTMAEYLIQESDKMLKHCNNDAELALEQLQNHILGHLSQNGKKFDQVAIRFYLLDQLINCNVFPIKK